MLETAAYNIHIKREHILEIHPVLYSNCKVQFPTECNASKAGLKLIC